MKRLLALACGAIVASAAFSACTKSSESSAAASGTAATPAGIATLSSDTAAAGDGTASTAGGASAGTTGTAPSGSASAGTATSGETNATDAAATSGETGSAGGPASAASAAPDAAAAAAAIAAAANPQLSPGQSVNYSKGDEKLSMGAGTADELASVGLPMYPAIQPAASRVISHSDGTESVVTVYTKVPDALKTVDDWYASKLGPDFKSSRLDMSGAQITTFEKEADKDHESVMLQTAKDGDAAATQITVIVDKKK